MPQKPTMPSPYMETVDAYEPITFSCAVDSRDTIVDYKFDIKEIEREETESASEAKVLMPTYYIGKISQSEDFSKAQLLFYKEFPEDTMYTMVVTPVNGYYERSSAPLHKGKDFTLNADFTIRRNEISRIIYMSKKVAWSDTYITPEVYPYYFQNFSNLKRIDFAGEFSRIGDRAFEGCTLLEEIELPDGLSERSVSATAFKGMSSLRKITAPHDGVCVSKEKNGYCQLPDVEELVFKKCFYHVDDTDSGKTQIIKGFFDYNTHLTKITYEEDVYRIQDGAFAGCTNLKEFKGISNVNVIGARAFQNCTSLTKVFSSVQKINYVGQNAFENTAIETVVINDSMTNLWLSAFENCEKLKNIEISGITGLYNENKLKLYKSAVRINNSVTIYINDDITDTEFWDILYESIPNLTRRSIYDVPSYTPIPLYGGKDGGILSYTLDGDTLKNDKEYAWNVSMTDALGKTIVSPYYYFKTRSSHCVEIEKHYTTVTEKYITDDNSKISTLETSHKILTEQPLFINKETRTSISNEGEAETTSDTIDTEIDTESVGFYVDGNKITTRIYDISTFNDDNDYEYGCFKIYRLPIAIAEDKYGIQVYIPTQEEYTDEEGEVQTIEIERLYTIVHEDGEGRLSNYKPGEKLSDPILFYIDDIKDESGTSVLDKVFNRSLIMKFDTSLEYNIFYDVPFSNDYNYYITYSYENDINNHTHTFGAKYRMADETANFIPVKRHRWTLYVVQDGNMKVIDDSGDIYSSYLSYTYSRFIPGKRYVLSLEVENAEGITAKARYAFDTENSYSGEFEEAPKVGLIERENAVSIKLYDASIFYSIIRTDVERGIYKLIAEDVHGEQTVYDYTAASNTRYTYTIYGYDTDGKISVFTSSEIRPEWCGVSVIGFTGSYANESPIVISDEDKWFFWLNVENIDYTQNISKQVSQSLSSRYPHISTGKMNYGTFNISALIGDISGCDYIRDSTIRVEKLQDFIASNKAKLVVDTKGRVCVCDTISGSNSYEGGYREQQTTIKISLTEIAPSDKVSLISIKAGV